MAATSPLFFFFCLPSSYASSRLLCSMGKDTSVRLREVLSLHEGSRPPRCRMLLTVRSSSPPRNLTTCQHSHETKLQGQLGGLHGSFVFCGLSRVFGSRGALWGLRGNRDAVWCWRLAGVAVVFIYLPHLPGEGPSQSVANPKPSWTFVRRVGACVRLSSC
ncbi:hypothetical protein IscW_ISCW023627 [Ixodes scapularis]|uniref:Secreted protein n=1 Tax=Ixodes scapularis TaxID=6945 RepID=B7QIL3_IXOSC|nr:hypothetical protein IscW_ISCW023627 [Ixodes scapularis]|eukprot:XP_002415020.1 hypothetical protein IscW_ISCW023627 [Ixodes scapularis]